ncbi:MAG: translocation/assembly module TamB domain-containing protein, partial [bacterium]|nr:translocation/assembly module TamB domain-containing protein [bacterium]
IVANYYSSDTAFASGAQLQQRISGLVSTQVSSIGTRQLNQLGVGVETFEIEPVYGNTGDALSARVTVGFYTAPNLYVYGRSPLSGQTGQEVGFEYRFNRALLVEGQRDEEELYHLNLKLHWEF